MPVPPEAEPVPEPEPEAELEPEPVARYIARHRLYRDQPPVQELNGHS